MNNAIDRAIAKAKKLKCNYIAYQPLHPDDLIEILEAMKDPSPKPEMISIPRYVAELWIEGTPFANSTMYNTVERALKDKQCSS